MKKTPADIIIYLLTSIAGYNIGLSGFEGHLWATIIAMLGILPLESGVALVMVISTILIGAGLILYLYSLASSFSGPRLSHWSCSHFWYICITGSPGEKRRRWLRGLGMNIGNT